MDKSEYSYVGILSKLQGYKGEFLLISEHPLHKNIIKWESVCIEIDGLLIPFFITSVKLPSDTAAIIGFERIITSETAKEFLSCKVYQSNKLLGKQKPKFEADYFTGYAIIDVKAGKIGIIDTLLNYNQNLLFRIWNNNLEILIPATEEYILKIDKQKKEITMQIPDGLIGLN